MPDSEDISLLKRYANGDEPAFTLLVERYIHLVYSTALRQVGNPFHAEEISQAVFIILTRKAKSISPKTILSGWLYQTARLTAANFLRSENSRQQREQEAYMQSTLTEPETRSWNEIAPLLEEAMGRLGQADHDAIVLRFFENKTPKELATMLGLNEVTARKRVSRALERLRNYFAKRGVDSTTSAIAETISRKAVHIAPVGLAKSVTAVALAKGAAASTSTLTLIKGVLKIMAWTKVKTAVVAAGVVLLVAGTTTVVVKEIQKQPVIAWETENFNTNIVNVINTMPPLVEIVPTKFPQSKGWGYSGGVLDQKLAGVGKTLKDIFYEANSTDLPSDRLIFPDDLLSNKYDYVVNLPSGSRQALEDKIKDQFGLVVKVEVQETNVLLLRMANRNAQGLKLHNGNPVMPSWYMSKGSSIFTWDNVSLFKLARFLEMYLATPVIDQTGTSANFDIKLKLKMHEFPADWKDHTIDDFQPALLNQLGLELVPTNMPIEMLVVEKAN